MKVFIGKYPKNVHKERKVKIQIDPWDTWNMDNTLALIITPMLKQLKEKTHGAPLVADEDVPESLRRAAAPPTKNEWDTDDNYFKRWQWVMDEMIFAFESKNTDWEEQFWKVKPEIDLLAQPKAEGQELLTELLWKEKGECDWEAWKMYEDRMKNGFRLFGKYYQGLWD